jgi:hypothetical protein
MLVAEGDGDGYMVMFAEDTCWVVGHWCWQLLVGDGRWLVVGTGG